MAKMNIQTFIKRFDEGNFIFSDVKTQIEAGWYDWFCRDTSLAAKTKSLGTKVKQIAKSEKVDAEKMYVFFKNNCPMYGRTYDDFRICDMETGEVIYTVTPSCGHDITKGQASVYGRENNFQQPLAEGKWKDIKEYFGV